MKISARAFQNHPQKSTQEGIISREGMGAGASSAIRLANLGSKTLQAVIGSREKGKDGTAPSILRVIAISGKDLPSTDSNGLSDPYLAVEFGESELKTEVRKKTLEPNWAQTLDFPVWKIPPDTTILEESRLLVKCWDWNAVGSHTFMGAVDVDLEGIEYEAPPKEKWHHLVDPANESAAGEIFLSIRWMARPDSIPDALLSLQIIAGRDLVPMMEDGFCNPYVVAKLQGQVVKTKIITRSTEPEWQELFEFKVYSSEIGIQTMFFECYDKGLLRDRLLGVSQQELSPVTFGQNLEAWIPLEQHRVEGAGKPRRKKDDDEDFGRIHINLVLKTRRENTEAELILRAVVLEARNLYTVKRNDTVDMYFIVEFENRARKTQVRFKQTLGDRPTWSETFDFDVWSDRMDSVLRIKAYDHNDWSKDVEVGSAVISVRDMSIGDLEEKWISLADSKHIESKLEVKVQMLLKNKPQEKDFDSLLSIRVVEARELPAMDYGGTSDPYIVVLFEGKSKRTSTIFKSLSPAWNELLEFRTKSSELDSKIFVECFDYDLTGKDDSCGRCEVEIMGLKLNQTIEGWFPLRDIAHPKFKGEVFLEVVLKPLDANADPDSQILAKVAAARGLVTANNDAPDAYCQIEFNDVVKKTGTRFKTSDPVFNESFQFVAHSSRSEAKIKFLLYDFNLIGKNILLGFATVAVGELTENKILNLTLTLHRKGSDDPVGELQVELLLKRLPEFFVSRKEKSKSLDLSYGFSDILTGMTRAQPVYELARRHSIASSGLLLDFESTEQLLTRQSKTSERDVWQQEWDEEQERRRAYDRTREAELRHETVENNIRKNRNRKGRCALCGEHFSVIKKAVQNPIDRLWYHRWAAKTVFQAEESCYDKYMPDLKKLLKRQTIRDAEHSDEILRRSVWDRDFQRRKALHTGRSNLNKAIITDQVSKLMKPTRMGHELSIQPPYCVRLFFSPREYEDLTISAQDKRSFIHNLQKDISRALNIVPQRVEITLIQEAFAAEIYLHQDVEGKDKWLPEGLAHRFAQMVNRTTATQVPPDLYYLLIAFKAEITGPVLTPNVTAKLNVNDVNVPENLQSKPVLPSPDQAGRISVRVYICGDYDDMYSERQYLDKSIWPVVNRWLLPYRMNFVPVDMRFGVTKSECFHKHVVRMHLDMIDLCFPFFICLLGERYGWVPDEYYLNYGDLELERFKWIKEFPGSLSLVHLEIIHAYFNRRIKQTAEHDSASKYCLFYFRCSDWMHDARYLADSQAQLAQIATEKKEVDAKQLRLRQAATQMENLAEGISQEVDAGMNILDVHILQGLDLAYYLENSTIDEQNLQLKRKKQKDAEAAANQAKEAKHHGIDVSNALAHAGGVIAGGAYSGGGMLAKGLAAGALGVAAGAAAGLSKFLMPVGQDGAAKRKKILSIGKNMKHAKKSNSNQVKWKDAEFSEEQEKPQGQKQSLRETRMSDEYSKGNKNKVTDIQVFNFSCPPI